MGGIGRSDCPCPSVFSNPDGGPYKEWTPFFLPGCITHAGLTGIRSNILFAYSSYRSSIRVLSQTNSFDESCRHCQLRDSLQRARMSKHYLTMQFLATNAGLCLLNLHRSSCMQAKELRANMCLSPRARLFGVCDFTSYHWALTRGLTPRQRCSVNATDVTTFFWRRIDTAAEATTGMSSQESDNVSSEDEDFERPLLDGTRTCRPDTGTLVV